MWQKSNIVSYRHFRTTRRGLLVGGLQLGFCGLLAWRMHHLQVEKADSFRLIADENRINIRLIPNQRGEIYDRNGVKLAGNEASYKITMVAEDAGDISLILERLSKIIKLSPEDINRSKAELDRSAKFLPVTIVDRLERDDIAKIAVNAPMLPGINPEIGFSRTYPLGEIFAHVVGYVGPVSSRDLELREDPDPLLRIPRFQIGKVGIERELETTLRGKAGIKRVEVNALGRVMREIERKEGSKGANLKLTLDTNLQAYVRARLGTESASVVVLDCKSGEILAICSSPAYDPNKFVRGISFNDYGILRDDNHRPLASKTVQDAYPPGSTFKMVTVLAALEAGIIDHREKIRCNGHVEVSSRKFHCWKRDGHGNVDLVKSLRESCDVYYYELAQRVGIEKIAEVARVLGLGKSFNIEMSAVTSGIVPDKLWKRNARSREWVVGDTVNSSIGQGYVLSSPLQLAVMMARIATGNEILPKLIKSINGFESDAVPGELSLNKNNLKLIRKALFEVTNDKRGTAYHSRVLDKKSKIIGKSGTSQVRNISTVERTLGVLENKDLPWDQRDHALFVNYAPYDDPKIAVSVVVEHGGSGSTVAAPIARDITLQAIYKGTPPITAYPVEDRARIYNQQRDLIKLMPKMTKSSKVQA
ncbi:MAG: penicillin-binding protein 2 [Paracoccaceae bacterium]|nr:penicillin-binding protein 2 [Marinovum sp.]MAV71818.1 penicillin-binding protein 2 [Marinovum sp.]